MKNIGTLAKRVDSLEGEKQKAILKEDFDTAKIIKFEMDKIKMTVHTVDASPHAARHGPFARFGKDFSQSKSALYNSSTAT